MARIATAQAGAGALVALVGRRAVVRNKLGRVQEHGKARPITMYINARWYLVCRADWRPSCSCTHTAHYLGSSLRVCIRTASLALLHSFSPSCSVGGAASAPRVADNCAGSFGVSPVVALFCPHVVLKGQGSSWAEYIVK